MKKYGFFLLCFFFVPIHCPANDSKADQESWFLDPGFEKYAVQVIAVLPMENFSFETGVDQQLFQEVYNNLTSKGYRRVSVDQVESIMNELGITTPGMLQGISLDRLAEKLNCDAVIRGGIDQSAAIHTTTYDAVVVSCSLELVHIKSKKVIWSTRQWRTAHRQWQVDPINMLINYFGHEKASRDKRIAWLVDEMMKTLPDGKIEVIMDNLLDRAVPVHADE